MLADMAQIVEQTRQQCLRLNPERMKNPDGTVKGAAGVALLLNLQAAFQSGLIGFDDQVGEANFLVGLALMKELIAQVSDLLLAQAWKDTGTSFNAEEARVLLERRLRELLGPSERPPGGFSRN